MVGVKKKNAPKINRIVFAIHCIEQDYAALKTFCLLMCLLCLIAQPSYDTINKQLVSVTKQVAAKSMRGAAEKKIA
ncbi:hypothetical protein CEXT_647371 [Caerostris extrusa]|uniref:Uncharacterized protein n=1 Tax=Caerostris extrusa TaxID=172846 RepID=A0AAV4NND2_CAEEX|nr:hypothetical protein CEXT_647371 [Caerostris extrusa]